MEVIRTIAEKLTMKCSWRRYSDLDSVVSVTAKLIVEQESSRILPGENFWNLSESQTEGW